MRKIICLYGGPGSGKSTTCAGLFYYFKRSGLSCEMNREYVKPWIWEGRSILEGDQPYFFAKSSRNERVLMKAGLDVIVTDSPLLLTHYYGLKYDPQERANCTSLVMLKHHHDICKGLGYSIDHYFIRRTKQYDVRGRLETEEQARKVDDELRSLLDGLQIAWEEVAGEDAAEEIFSRYSIDRSKE